MAVAVIIIVTCLRLRFRATSFLEFCACLKLRFLKNPYYTSKAYKVKIVSQYRYIVLQSHVQSSIAEKYLKAGKFSALEVICSRH